MRRFEGHPGQKVFDSLCKLAILSSSSQSKVQGKNKAAVSCHKAFVHLNYENHPKVVFLERYLHLVSLLPLYHDKRSKSAIEGILDSRRLRLLSKRVIIV